MYRASIRSRCLAFARRAQETSQSLLSHNTSTSTLFTKKMIIVVSTNTVDFTALGIWNWQQKISCRFCNIVIFSVHAFYVFARVHSVRM